jgi:signal transduction histidine kinase
MHEGDPPVSTTRSGSVSTSALSDERSGSSARTDRSIALIRIAVLAVVGSVYVSSLGVRRSMGSSAILVLVLACVYGLVCLLAAATEEGTSPRIRALSLLIDICLITAWVQATGGARSEFWSLYLIVIVSAGLRFSMPGTVGIAAALAVLYWVVVLEDQGLSGQLAFYRPALILLTGFAVGALSHQRAIQRRRRREVEALAESRGVELGKERAEVERLRRVDLTRSEFVAVAAHEFRTPLAAIIGVLSTLRTHGASLRAQVRIELIDGAAAQAERLARLVEDLLTVSRIEDGVLRLALSRTDARHLVSEATRASGAAGRVDVDLHRVDPVVCDPDAVIRVLTNLLDNALKYSPEGARVAINVSQDDDRVRFAVRDSGPGVPEEAREAIFERFRRGEGSGKPGVGLGLYISRGLVRAHGGELSVGQAERGGAEFVFWLPRRSADEDTIDIEGRLDLEAGEPGDLDVTEITASLTGPR